MTKSTLLHRVLPLALGAAMMCGAQAATPSFDLGVAGGFSAFIYGNASNFTDVEGRMAVGGDVSTTAFSIGYRTPYNTGLPSLVVGGNLTLGSGTIYGPAPAGVNTNIGMGPTTGYALNWNGTGVYGGTATTPGYYSLTASSNIASYVDFSAARTQLTQLSATLNSQTTTGATVLINSSGIHLTGDNTSDLQVFNVATRDLYNLTLSNVKAGATVVINVTGTGGVVFSGGQDGQLSSLNVLYNLNNATDVSVNTLIYGSVLANDAILHGSGHVEGTLIAQGMDSAVEIGYEPFHAYVGVAAPVPEPETWAMLLAGLALVGWARLRHGREQTPA